MTKLFAPYLHPSPTFATISDNRLKFELHPKHVTMARQKSFEGVLKSVHRAPRGALTFRTRQDSLRMCTTLAHHRKITTACKPIHRSVNILIPSFQYTIFPVKERCLSSQPLRTSIVGPRLQLHSSAIDSVLQIPSV